MLAGEVDFFLDTYIIFLEWKMYDFAYGQTLIYYKEDIEKIKSWSNVNLK